MSRLNLKSSSSSDKASSTHLIILPYQFPLGKFGFGFGLMPYTSVGYKLETLNDNGDLLNRYRGEGGLNKVYLVWVIALTKDLSVGVECRL